MSDRRIQKLDKQVADQITSQQIIPTLHQCIKELVDNSVDAKATLIKIQLQEYGKEEFSVFDNGLGIKDISKLGEGGNTSKLIINQNNSEQYLQGVRTLGFRGQAVNSIAHLCKQMIIHTVFHQQKQEQPKFRQIKYSVSRRKQLQNKGSVSRQTFTKVTVQNLFCSLPVRKHQLQSRPKENVKKVYEVVFQISLIYPQITFILANRVEDRQQILFEIQRNVNKRMISQPTTSVDYFYQAINKEAWKERIQICFPKKFDDCLVFTKSNNLQGFILNTIDSGSSKKNLKFSKNLQYTFINRRPINPLKQICRIFDGYYKKYNPYTKYVFFINLRVDPSDIDINLSPNKRDIFIKKDMLQSILEQLRASIEKQVIQKITNLQQFKQAKQKKLIKKQKSQNQSELTKRQERLKEKGQFDNSQQMYQVAEESVKIRNQAFRSMISQQLQDRSLKGNYLLNYHPISNQLQNSNIQQLNRRINQANIGLIKSQKLTVSQEIVCQIKVKTEIQEVNSQSQEDCSESPGREGKSGLQKNQDICIKDAALSKNRAFQSYSIIVSSVQKVRNPTDRIVKSQKQRHFGQVYKQKQDQGDIADLKKQSQRVMSDEYRQDRGGIADLQECLKKIGEEHIPKIQPQCFKDKIKYQGLGNIIIPTVPHKERVLKLESKTQLSPNDLVKQAKNQLNVQCKPERQRGQDKSKHQHRQDNNNLQYPLALNYVTEETSGQISKDNFRRFHIHGQFNKGFILCSFYDKRHFYIIDQHASQQKRLFQTFIGSKPTYYYLCKQISLTPLQVDQVQMSRQQLIESGFSFDIQDRTMLRVTKCPSHFKKNFGLDQFIQIAETNKNIKQIPSFYNSAASKACRSAVMIGDQLDRKRMKDIVHSMSDLKSPWNCPHGRPSLISLGSFNSSIKKINSPRPVYKF